MIRFLLLVFCLLGPIHGEETTVANLLPGLSSEEFQERKEAMKKLEAYAEKHPQKTIKELQPILRKLSDPEARLRLTTVAKKLLNLEPTKALFGFTFSLNESATYNEKPVTGVVVSYVVRDSRAQLAGLRVQDTILAIDGTPFPRDLTQAEIQDIFARQVPEKKVTLTILRAGELIDFPARPKLENHLPEILEERQLKYKQWLQEPSEKETE